MKQKKFMQNISLQKQQQSIFRDEIMKNLNWTEHEKRFVENFYGCLNWAAEHFDEYLPALEYRMNLPGRREKQACGSINVVK